jgi:hypothetical protein
MRYFKNAMKTVIEKRLLPSKKKSSLPHDFLVNHIARSFIELVYWWIEGDMKYSPT